MPAFEKGQIHKWKHPCCICQIYFLLQAKLAESWNTVLTLPELLVFLLFQSTRTTTCAFFQYFLYYKRSSIHIYCETACTCYSQCHWISVFCLDLYPNEIFRSKHTLWSSISWDPCSFHCIHSWRSCNPCFLLTLADPKESRKCQLEELFSFLSEERESEHFSNSIKWKG